MNNGTPIVRPKFVCKHREEYTMSKDKHRGVENPAAARAAAERAQSNAWGTHDNRPHRERSRADSKRAAIKRDVA